MTIEDSHPTTRSVLHTLTNVRLVELGRTLGIALPNTFAKESKDTIVTRVMGARDIAFRTVVEHLFRDELREACRVHDLLPKDEHVARSRPLLMQKLLEAHGDADSLPPPARFGSHELRRSLPRATDIVRCRQREWLVEGVTLPPNKGDATRVSLVCLDDDNRGVRIEVLWELELGARVLAPETHGLGAIETLDDPEHFAAYLHALTWSTVTATDPGLFQAPFRAGIKLLNHQLTPLQRALRLPRANLFIADDVGLGKTIEAGLVVSELLLRQRVDFALIVCPPSVALQWQTEMFVRFGLSFEIMNRAFIAQRRRERGFAVNPWSTHNRFIVSYQTLRRPEYRDPLLARLDALETSQAKGRAAKSLLILDEAHTAAPAGGQSRYAIDSRITRVIRDVTPRFENRLFLSATPHNGHSNSFSALLEMLDPQRFTRAVPVQARARDEIMVRRLKEDLRTLGVDQFPHRRIVRIPLRHQDGTFRSGSTVLGAAPGAELELSTLLAEYTELAAPQTGRGKLVFMGLQKRLLSSIEAFARTLEVHADNLAGNDTTAAFEAPDGEEDDAYGITDEERESADATRVAQQSRAIQTPAGQARTLLDKMRKLANDARHQPDGKLLALLDWIRSHSMEGKRWSTRRIIVFTEYGDTKKWLVHQLEHALGDTDDRILQMHGGMSDDQRAEVQRRWNDPTDSARILVATDAAREGVNLQGACADLFHFDVPWNPARLEQRNGRIDRTLQPEPEVRCHYFVYEDRAEDAVLDKLVQKVENIKKELGSMGAVLHEKLDKALAYGITKSSAEAVDALDDAQGANTTKAELEAIRKDLDRVRKEIDEAGRSLELSRKHFDFEPTRLRRALDIALRFAGAPHGLEEAKGEANAYLLPPLPESWAETLDTLRAPRGADEPFWEWRKRPLPAVTFTPPKHVHEQRVHLHLSHPLVVRLLSRFRAQGFSAHDLSRVTVLRTPHVNVPRAIAFARLTLFGAGAECLHDEILRLATPWVASVGDTLAPEQRGLEEAERKALEDLLATRQEDSSVSAATRTRLTALAPTHFAALWETLKVEADARAHDAEERLTVRGREESRALGEIIQKQVELVVRQLGEREQGRLAFETSTREARDQWENDMRYLEDRLTSLRAEYENEPKSLQALYRVALRKLSPVGLVYLWPETMG